MYILFVLQRKRNKADAAVLGAIKNVVGAGRRQLEARRPSHDLCDHRLPLVLHQPQRPVLARNHCLQWRVLRSKKHGKIKSKFFFLNFIKTNWKRRQNFDVGDFVGKSHVYFFDAVRIVQESVERGNHQIVSSYAPDYT